MYTYEHYIRECAEASDYGDPIHKYGPNEFVGPIRREMRHASIPEHNITIGHPSYAESVLQCPMCAEGYTHLTRVDPYIADEHESRYSVRLHFLCEMGCPDFNIVVHQHKGQTLIGHGRA